MPEKVCDHTSVGMIVKKDDEILLIERRKSPFGFAPPAGHVDDKGSFENAAKEELEEEVGLHSKSLSLLVEGRKENHCRRVNGTWHYWKIYTAEVEGEVQRSPDETKQAGWFSPDQVKSLALRTENYLQGSIPQTEWEQSPGLEPVWYEWFKELKIIP